MERLLLTGAALVAVGIMLVAVWVLLTYGGPTFEMIEDHIAGWLDKA